jgi:hypothetical protein
MMAGDTGLEPVNGGIKIRCLTNLANLQQFGCAYGVVPQTFIGFYSPHTSRTTVSLFFLQKTLRHSSKCLSLLAQVHLRTCEVAKRSTWRLVGVSIPLPLQ